MLVYYGSYILHTAVTYFDVVHVEKGVILVLLTEVFRYELNEGFADVSLHAAVKRRIMPDNATLAVSTWSITLSAFVVGKACCVSTGFEGVVIGSLSFVLALLLSQEQLRLILHNSYCIALVLAQSVLHHTPVPPFSPIVIRTPLFYSSQICIYS